MIATLLRILALVPYLPSYQHAQCECEVHVLRLREYYITCLHWVPLPLLSFLLCVLFIIMMFIVSLYHL